MYCNYFSCRINVEKILNSAALATATHKRLKEVSDGMGTQVGIQVINKYKVQMIRKDLYNVEEPPMKQGAERE